MVYPAACLPAQLLMVLVGALVQSSISVSLAML